jgi:poly(A) polymerase
MAPQQGYRPERPAALYDAMDAVLERQRERPRLPAALRRHHQGNLGAATRFEQRSGARPYRLLEHPRFRAGYDFLMLRARSGDAPDELADWWQRFQNADDSERPGMLIESSSASGKKRRPRRRRSRADAGPAGDSADNSALQ